MKKYKYSVVFITGPVDDFKQFVDDLNTGWEIVRCDATQHSFIYILKKEI